MAGFGVLIVSGILSAISAILHRRVCRHDAYIMASYALRAFSIACMRKKGDPPTFLPGFPFASIAGKAGRPAGQRRRNV